MKRLRRWGVYDPKGELVSRHLFHRTAFYEARGRSLKEQPPVGLWLVRNVNKVKRK